MPISGRLNLSPFAVLTTYVPANATDKPSEIGAMGTTPDGRTFKLGYITSTATTISPARNTQGPAVAANQQGVTLSTQSIGDTTVTATFSSSTIAANAYAQGYLGVVSGTGGSTVYQIKSHPAVTSGLTVLLTLMDPIAIATSGSPTANLWAHPYSSVIICPISLTGTVTGSPLVSVVADSTYGTYAWFQTGGLGLCLNQGSTTAGLGLAPSTTTAGTLATVGSTTQQVATADQAGTDATVAFVNWDIAS